MSGTYLGSKTLGASLGVMGSLAPGLDQVRLHLLAAIDALEAARLTIRAEAVADLEASLDASLELTASVSDPAADLLALVSAAQSLAVEVMLSPPSLDVQLDAGLSLQADLTAQVSALDAKLGALTSISAALQAILALPIFASALEIAAALSTPGVHLARSDGAGSTLGADLQDAFEAPLGGALSTRSYCLAATAPAATTALSMLFGE